MHDRTLRMHAAIARHRTGPYAESRERFLNEAFADGYSPATLESKAWALHIVAGIVHRNGGSITLERLTKMLERCVRSRSPGRPPSKYTIEIILQSGKAWLSSIGALITKPERTEKLATERRAFAIHSRVERGLSPVTIANRDRMLGWFCSSLPSGVRSLKSITISHVDAFLKAQTSRGWRRQSVRVLGGQLRIFFRYAASQGWCQPELASSIELLRVYKLADVPRAPSAKQISRLLDEAAAGDQAIDVRDHAILALLIQYGLRRGEVERLTLDDIDWRAETIRVTRPKAYRAQVYPMSVPVGEAILRYLRFVRPRCRHRALFLTILGPVHPLSGTAISAMVRTRLTKQGVQMDRRGAHCLRHACAGRLLDAGFTLKEIADHLGHRNMESTRIYTKIDLQGLRQVSEFDLGALL